MNYIIPILSILSLVLLFVTIASLLNEHKYKKTLELVFKAINDSKVNSSRVVRKKVVKYALIQGDIGFVTDLFEKVTGKNIDHNFYSEKNDVVANETNTEVS